MATTSVPRSRSLRGEGARTVFLIGASFGGAAALTYAPALPLAGVISLSGEAQFQARGWTRWPLCRDCGRRC